MKLSICIPTYNRDTFLKHLLYTIGRQIMDAELNYQIEIVISDNNSNDNTEGMISLFEQDFPNISLKYHKNKCNVGADANYIEVVKRSYGEYFWIVGSDDDLYDNAITHIYEQITHEYHSIYLLQCDIYTKDMSKMIRTDSYFSDEIYEGYVFDLKDETDWAFYFEHAISIYPLMSYLSSIVCRRDVWDKVMDFNPYVGTAYVHSYIILNSLYKYGGDIKLIKQSIVKNRQGNDSFYKNAYQRIMLDFKGYLKVGSFYSEYLMSKMKRIIRGCYKENLFNDFFVDLPNFAQKELIEFLNIYGYRKEFVDLLERRIVKSVDVDKAINHFFRIWDSVEYVYFYGYGNYALKLTELCDANNKSISSYIVTNIDNNTTIKHNLCCIDDFIKSPIEKRAIVLSLNPAYHGEIKKRLLYLEDCRVYPFDEAELLDFRIICAFLGIVFMKPRQM